MRLGQRTNPRILVLGLDGFGTDLLNILKCKYPNSIKNILELKRKGTFSSLQSSLPPITPVAWPSFLTGTTAGRHNIYDFIHNGKCVNSLSIKAKTLWSILRENRKKIGALHVPMTYPPERIDGFIVPGQLAPSFNEASIYPASLYREFHEFFKHYQAFCEDYDFNGYGPTNIDAFIEALADILKKKITLNLMLLDKYPDLDVFISVFFETDTIQHFLWKYIDETHALANKEDIQRYRPKILNLFKALDDAVGQITERFGRDALILIISDHGQQPFIRHFHANVWLKEQGLLQFKQDNGFKSKIFAALSSLIEKLMPSEYRADPLAIDPSFLCRLSRRLKSKRIDYCRSKAFVYSESGIRVNLKGREAQGTVNPGSEYEDLRQSIIKSLLELRDEKTGKAIIEQALISEQAFAGPYLKNAPDIIFTNSVGYWADSLFPFATAIEDTRYKTAHHSLGGILIACGQGIKPNYELGNARLIDIMPTILYVLGLALPKNIDGAPLVQMFENNFISPEDVKYEDLKEMAPYKSKARPFNKADEEKVRRRLEDLGYIT